jgi:hypothetical protein
MTFNFTIFLCFSNIRNQLSNFNRSRFYLFLKTENSRRVAESRSVCVGLKGSIFARTDGMGVCGKAWVADVVTY